MASVVLVLRVGLAVIFVTAGLAKLADLRSFRQTMRGFGVPGRAADVGATVLPFAELATAVALLPQPSARWGGVAALILFGVFIGGIVNALRNGRRPDCNCFGQLASSRVGPRTLARNAVLAAVAAVLVWQAPGASISSWTGNHSAADLIAVLAFAACAVLVVVLFRYRKQNEDLTQWLHRTTRELASLPSGLPVGLRAPSFELPNPHGELVSLQQLCDRGRPVVLLFTSPTCGPCIRLLPDLERWQGALGHHVTFATLATGGGPPNATQHLLQPGSELLTLQQEGQEILDEYRVRSTPTAVVVNPDGRIGSGYVSGSVEIEELVRLTLRRGEPQPADTPPAAPARVAA